MIVRQFLQWVRTAPPGLRAEATGALARAYLYSDLSEDDRSVAEGAMVMLLDDTSPLVRRALAEALGGNDRAPPAVIHGLASDQADIAVLVLGRSNLFIDADLVEIVATSEATIQCAIASRPELQRSVAAAIAEVGAPEACLTMIENPGADMAPFSVNRIVERHGHLGAIREALLARDDIPASTRQALVAKLADVLADFVSARAWLAPDRAQRVAKEACEKATVTIAATVPHESGALIRHLRESGQLTTGLILRAVLSGNICLFEDALAELSGVSLTRVRGIVNSRGAIGFRALYDKAGLPASTYPAFREAIGAMRETQQTFDPGVTGRLKRRVIERVLIGCARSDLGDIEPLAMLLRRFATEAAREDARQYCDELVAEDLLTIDYRYDRIAA
ncbi:MAG TPA: DUF2336 domain-containing protein [Xanthobacteraceae bacterium]|nr:DUF2336 domain-containing protein [Xanthobacteraceae bacterium]